MTESEYQAYKEKAIEQDVLAVENRIRHAFNQGVECGRKLTGLKSVIDRNEVLNEFADWYGYGFQDSRFYRWLKDVLTTPNTPQDREETFSKLVEGMERVE